jgi:hypothetical protein
MMQTEGLSLKTSPFKRPDDKDVFLARDTEKQKRMEAKEKAKNLKIWDKKTATSRLPLKKFRDAEIPPADTDKHVFILTSKEKDVIDAAKNICKARVQFPKDQRSQNAYEFIEQKKEMFLVQLSHNTIKKEIDLLNTKIDNKQEALEKSAFQLNEDEKIVRTYVEKDNEITKTLETQADGQQLERKKKEEEIKNIDSQIQNLRSEYQKHLDTLENLQDHQEFLQKISDVEFIKHNKSLANKKTEELKK